MVRLQRREDCQGKKNAAVFLKENPHIAEEIELQIRAQLLGGDTEEAANSEETPANDDDVIVLADAQKSS